MKKVTFKSGDYAIFTKENEKNKIFFYDFQNRDFGHAENVDSNFGNYWYKKSFRWLDSFTDYIDAFWLDLSAFDEDYDSYSDYYKDVNGVRPHYTEKQWNARIAEAKKRKP